MKMIDYGKRLKMARLRYDLTQQELAEKIYTTQSSIYQYENGKCRIDLETAIELAQVLDIDISELYDVRSLGVRIEIDHSTNNEYDPELVDVATAYLQQIMRMKCKAQ